MLSTPFLAEVHDAVATTMCRCRRLIIILSPEAKRVTRDEDREDKFLCEDQTQHYEQKIGLFDALTLNDPKVVLVELGENNKIVATLTAFITLRVILIIILIRF